MELLNRVSAFWGILKYYLTNVMIRDYFSIPSTNFLTAYS